MTDTSALPALFAGFDEDSARTVATLLREKTFERGERLFHQGATGVGAYFIMDGEVDIHVLLPGGAVSHIARRGPGQVLGELSLLSEEHRRTATATAVGRVWCKVMERRDLLAICAQYHPASLPVLGRLADQVSAAITQINDERVRLGRAPRAGIGDPSPPAPVREFSYSDHLLSLPFTTGFRPEEVQQLLDAGTVVRLGRSTFVDPDVGKVWFVVLRGALSMCAPSDGELRRLALVGPGCVAVSDAFLADGVVGAREGATALMLDEDTVRGWRDGAQRWAHRALEALVRDLLGRMAHHTRSLTRERRQAVLRQVEPPI